MNRLVWSVVGVCAILGSYAADVFGAQDQGLEAVRSAKRATAMRIDSPIRMDGMLDDEAWQRAEPVSDFYQQVPEEFAPASRRTVVRFLYTDSTLYVGAMLYDDPDALIVNDLKRDFNGRATDSLALVLDTFRDRQNAYGFLTNPGGAMRDTLASDAGRLNDANWDAVWSARSTVLPDGWSLELAIPFKSLRFPAGQDQTWGLNMLRTSRSINELSAWSPVPRQFSHYNVVFAGTLDGIAGVQPGLNLYVKPFATAQFGTDVNREPGWSGDGDGGVDLKWAVSSSLSLDATWRTDFSQVEADEQQINLTRFSTFFPEKRQFFLENPANFQIGIQEPERRDLVPFFSRRIGLSGGEPVPVVGGVRLTGQPAGQRIGFLNMQTETFEGDPGDNFTALVLKRRLSNSVSAGGFYFGRESKGPDSFNRVGGLDFRYQPQPILDVEAFAMRSGSANSPGDWAGRLGFLLDGNQHSARVAWLHVGDTFRHDLGFVRRQGVGMLFSTYSLALRPASSGGRIREHTIGGSFEGAANDRYSDVLTRIGSVRYGTTFSDGGSFSAEVNRTFEKIDEPFPVGDLSVPAGQYSFTDAGVSYTSNDSKTISGRIAVQAGEFWTGRQRELSGSLRFRVNEHLAASATFSRNVVTLPMGSFTGELVGLRIDTSFTPRMFLNAFVQYNGETDAWLSNIRFNLMHRPLSDIYVVWNETRASNDAHRAVLLKYTHLLAF